MGTCFGRDNCCDRDSYAESYDYAEQNFDKTVEKITELIDEVSEGITEQLDISYQAENGLQHLLNSINASLKGNEQDDDIEYLKAELKDVLNKATVYRTACFMAAKRGSHWQEIYTIKQDIRSGDLSSLFQLITDMKEKLNTCSHSLESLYQKCESVRLMLTSAMDRYEKDKEKAERGVKDSKIARDTGIGAIIGGAILTLFLPPAGIAVTAAGIATATGGGIGVAVHEGRLMSARKALNKIVSLSSSLQRIKNRVSRIQTTMDECMDIIIRTNRSGLGAQKKGRVSAASCMALERSLDNMYQTFEDLIQNRL